jgi:hypothetical protein
MELLERPFGALRPPEQRPPFDLVPGRTSLAERGRGLLRQRGELTRVDPRERLGRVVARDVPGE